MNLPYTILVVDDEESLVKLAAHVLEMHGYRVLGAPHGEAALGLIASQPGKIDLLLTDVRMDPYMSGCLLAQRLRHGRPELRVIYMTAYPASEIVRKEVQQGAAALLRKPFTPTALLEKVNAVLHALAAPYP